MRASAIIYSRHYLPRLFQRSLLLSLVVLTSGIAADAAIATPLDPSDQLRGSDRDLTGDTRSPGPQPDMGTKENISIPVQLAQAPNIIPPDRPPSPIPPIPTEPAPPPGDPLDVPSSPTLPPGIPSGEIIVERFEFEFEFVDPVSSDNRPFSAEDLAREIKEPVTETPLESVTNQEFSYLQLFKIGDRVRQFYASKGYRTSTATIFIPEETQQKGKGIVTIKVIEGQLEEIKITGPSSTNPETQTETEGKLRLRRYVRSRLARIDRQPLNLDQLEEVLLLLERDGLIEKVSATLSEGSRLGKTVLEVEIKEAQTFQPQFSLDNGRSPSVGSFRRQITLTEANLLGLGDGLSVGYTNTDGSNGLDISYMLPLNARNMTLRLAYGQTKNDVIEPPFNRLDIESKSRYYEGTLRLPLVQTINQEAQTFQEVALGLTASLRESESTLLDEPFPLSPGADADGLTRVFALRFSQEWTRQGSRSVFAIRSEFSLGLDGFDSTINSPLVSSDSSSSPETVEVLPDSEFFAWRGQAQWVKLLSSETLLLVRANGQLADRALLSQEQFAIGGLGSVRGYRQDTILTDNGVFASAEVILPVLRIAKWRSVLQAIPFVDYGIGWNNSDRPNPDPQTLASLGVGLQWRHGNNFTARLEWGIPLVFVRSRERTWQENGLYFTIQWNPF